MLEKEETMSDEQESFDLFGDMHPYNKLFKVSRQLPEKGRGEEEVLKELEYMANKENPKWLGGQCSGTMYHGGMEHYAFLNKVFSLYSFVNLLQRDLCPSGTKFEAEVLAMVGQDAARRGREQGQPDGRGGRRHHIRRHRQHLQRHGGLPRMGPRGEGHHRPRVGGPHDHPPGAPQGCPPAGDEDDPRCRSTATTKPTWRPCARAITAQHRRAVGQRRHVPARRSRSHREALGDGAGAQDRPARGWLPGRLHTAVDREAGLQGAAVGFPRCRA